MWKCGNCAAVLDDEYFECYICGKQLDQGDLIIDEMYEQYDSKKQALGNKPLVWFQFTNRGLRNTSYSSKYLCCFWFHGRTDSYGAESRLYWICKLYWYVVVYQFINN